MELALIKYFTGVGGTLLLAILCLMVVFSMHANSRVTPTRVYQAIGLVYIGAMVGLTIIVVTLPLLCWFKSTLVCYRIF